MRKIKLIIAYDGTPFGGWQTQVNTTSIQELVEKALSIPLREPITVTSAGRTDAGVHAQGQTAHFTTSATPDLKRLILSANALLPPEIRLLSAMEVPLDFHARYSARGKIYHYRLHLTPSCDPFKRLYSYHVPYLLNLDALKSATKYFLGRHDFTAFANEAHRGSAAKNAVRTLYRLCVIEEEGGIRLEFEGEGFLYKMIRNIVGTLLDVARGNLAEEQIPRIFASRDRRLASMAAPPQGLCLMEVIYTRHCVLIHSKSSDS